MGGTHRVLPPHIFVSCIILAASTTMLIYYCIQFVRFAKADNEERRIQNLNQTVKKMLEHQQRDKGPTIIDITDYIHVSSTTPTDTYIDELSNKSLIYMDDIKMWIKVNKESN